MSPHGHDRRVEAVLEYWFGPAPDEPAAVKRNMRRWFGFRPTVDAEVRERFADLVDAAPRGGLDGWSAEPRGRLALILLLDQFRRNLHRRSAAAFAGDAAALELCADGIAAGHDAALHLLERAFFYMPLQHAESLEAQRRSVEAFEALAREAAPRHVRDCLESFARFAREHHAIIERFGRFPHRNDVLGRTSTAAEREYLERGGTRYGQ